MLNKEKDAKHSVDTEKLTSLPRRGIEPGCQAIATDALLFSYWDWLCADCTALFSLTYTFFPHLSIFHTIIIIINLIREGESPVHRSKVCQRPTENWTWDHVIKKNKWTGWLTNAETWESDMAHLSLRHSGPRRPASLPAQDIDVSTNSRFVSWVWVGQRHSWGPLLSG